MRKQYHTRTVGNEQHTWDVHRLVRLAKELPTTVVPLSQIAETDEVWWYRDEDDVPTPRSIATHMALVEQTDLRFPILLCSDGRLMDGMHRVVKALLEGREMIDVVRFTSTPAPDHINVDAGTLTYADEDV